MLETLTGAGCEVTEADNAKETVRRLFDGPAPDLILLDYRLPDSADLRVFERSEAIVPRSAVIMTTAYGTSAMQADALELGAHRVLNKPVEMRDLLMLVQQAHDAGSQ
jgi:DNA-binding NtrC family response regulator